MERSGRTQITWNLEIGPVAQSVGLHKRYKYRSTLPSTQCIARTVEHGGERERAETATFQSGGMAVETDNLKP